MVIAIQQFWERKYFLVVFIHFFQQQLFIQAHALRVQQVTEGGQNLRLNFSSGLYGVREAHLNLLEVNGPGLDCAE